MYAWLESSLFSGGFGDVEVMYESDQTKCNDNKTMPERDNFLLGVADNAFPSLTSWLDELHPDFLKVFCFFYFPFG